LKPVNALKVPRNNLGNKGQGASVSKGHQTLGRRTEVIITCIRELKLLKHLLAKILGLRLNPNSRFVTTTEVISLKNSNRQPAVKDSANSNAGSNL
jgi:hypothetical protein